MKELFCGCVSEDKYIYDLGSSIQVVLCPNHHMQLAGEVMKQLAIEVFVPELSKKKERSVLKNE